MALTPDEAALDATLAIAELLDEIVCVPDPAVERALTRVIASLWDSGEGRHLRVAARLTNLALVLHRRGGSAIAVRLYEKGLAIRESVQGADHPDLVLPLLQYEQALAACA